MRIGLSRPKAPPYPTPDVDAAFVAARAEAAGFDLILYGEHAITPVEEGISVPAHPEGVPFFQETVVALSRVSAATKRIRFGFGVCLMFQHHPVRLAKQLACLDHYSGGRLVVGVGTGWSPAEAAALGARLDRRWAQTAEATALMRALWTGERVEHDGEFWKVPPVRCFPRPARAGGPPILIGSSTPVALERIAAYGDGWLPAFVTPQDVAEGPDRIRAGRARIRQLAERAGRDPDAFSTIAILLGNAGRDEIARYEDAGVDDLTFTLPYYDSEQSAADMVDRLAERLLR